VDGRITREEVQELIVLSASANKLAKLKEQGEEYAALIMEELDPENLGYIEVRDAGGGVLALVFVVLPYYGLRRLLPSVILTTVESEHVCCLRTDTCAASSLPRLASCGSSRRCCSSATPT